MKTVYFDSNIFMYLSESGYPQHDYCFALIEYCQHNQIQIKTSTETIQEIIHVSKKHKAQENGIAYKTIQLTEPLIAIHEMTIGKFLELAKIYPEQDSRDLIHIAVCIANNIPTLITYDKKMKWCKELPVVTPEEYMKRARRTSHDE